MNVGRGVRGMLFFLHNLFRKTSPIKNVTCGMTSAVVTFNNDHLKESSRLLNMTFPHLKHSCNRESM